MTSTVSRLLSEFGNKSSRIPRNVYRACAKKSITQRDHVRGITNLSAPSKQRACIIRKSAVNRHSKHYDTTWHIQQTCGQNVRLREELRITTDIDKI